MSWQGLWLQTLCAILLASSLPLQVFAGAPRRLVGRVEATDGVTVGLWPARSNDAVFFGDVLATSKASSALVKFSALSQSSVLQQSSVRFQLDAAGHPVAKLASGMVLTTTAGENAVMIETTKYSVRPAEPERTIYLVGLLPDKSTIVAARQGNISIIDVRSGKRYLLNGGRYIVIESSASGVPGQEEEKSKQAPGKPAGQAAPPTPSAKPQPKPKPVKQPWHIGSLSHAASIAVIIAAAGGAAGAVAAVAGGGGPSASPSAP